VVLNEAFALSPAGYLLRCLRGRRYAATPQVGALGGGWTSTTGRARVLPSVIGGGVHVLSRRGLSDRHQLIFSRHHPRTEDALAAKGCALVRLDGPLWIAATHLQADESPVPVEQTQAVRLHQLAEIRALVESVVPPGEPVVLAGDLNVEHGNGHLTAAAAVGGSLDPDGPIHAPTFDGTRNPLAGNAFRSYAKVIDYIASIGNVPLHITTETIRFQPGEEASDHYPVIAHLH
jgi:endonuclease/exonuclease/phosphatase family metal-dependent hydrolase